MYGTVSMCTKKELGLLSASVLQFWIEFCMNILFAFWKKISVFRFPASFHLVHFPHWSKPMTVISSVLFTLSLSRSHYIMPIHPTPWWLFLVYVYLICFTLSVHFSHWSNPMPVISSIFLLVALPNCNATPCLWRWLVAYCHGSMCLRNSHLLVAVCGYRS